MATRIPEPAEYFSLLALLMTIAALVRTAWRPSLPCDPRRDSSRRPRSSGPGRDRSAAGGDAGPRPPDPLPPGRPAPGGRGQREENLGRNPLRVSNYQSQLIPQCHSYSELFLFCPYFLSPALFLPRNLFQSTLPSFLAPHTATYKQASGDFKVRMSNRTGT